MSEDPDIREWAAQHTSVVDINKVATCTATGLLRDPDARVARIATDSLARKARLHPIAALLEHDLERPYRVELWAVHQLAMVAGPTELNFAMDAIKMYVRAGGAAQAQAQEHLKTLSSEPRLSYIRRRSESRRPHL